MRPVLKRCNILDRVPIRYIAIVVSITAVLFFGESLVYLFMRCFVPSHFLCQSPPHTLLNLLLAPIITRPYSKRRAKSSSRIPRSQSSSRRRLSSRRVAQDPQAGVASQAPSPPRRETSSRTALQPHSAAPCVVFRQQKPAVQRASSPWRTLLERAANWNAIRDEADEIRWKRFAGTIDNSSRHPNRSVHASRMSAAAVGSAALCDERWRRPGGASLIEVELVEGGDDTDSLANPASDIQGGFVRDIP
uniref:Uncharacterized protein n=1 Tax=Macrostomum lignano TaxID=282301 RepID=A0A1I8FIG0_9PLAT